MPGPGGTYVENFPAVQPVSFDGAQHVVVDSLPSTGGSLVDVSDRSARLVGVVSVGNWPGTQPISAATLPLPTGAATSAKQPTLDADGGAPAHISNWPATQPVSLASLPTLPSGTALIGKVGIDQTTPGTTNGVQITNASIAVTGSFFPATQPISATSLPLPTGAATAAGQPTINADGGALTHVMNWPTTQPISAAALPLPAGAATSANQPTLNADGGAPAHVTNFPATQPISAAALPLPTGAALDATLTGGTQRNRVTDGTNNAAVKAASTQAVATDPALVVSMSPNMGPSANSLLPSAAASINATVVKASAGRLYKVKGYNAAAAVRYIKFWNKATTPAPASDAALIVFSYPLKASDQFDIDLTPVGFAFSTGIGFTISTGSANADATAVTAADIVGLNVMYT